jgi:hypothetical protein
VRALVCRFQKDPRCAADARHLPRLKSGGADYVLRKREDHDNANETSI